MFKLRFWVVLTIPDGQEYTLTQNHTADFQSHPSSQRRSAELFFSEKNYSALRHGELNSYRNNMLRSRV